jgi:hypothetical protein
MKKSIKDDIPAEKFKKVFDKIYHEKSGVSNKQREKATIKYFATIQAEESKVIPANITKSNTRLYNL